MSKTMLGITNSNVIFNNSLIEDVVTEYTNDLDTSTTKVPTTKVVNDMIKRTTGDSLMSKLYKHLTCTCNDTLTTSKSLLNSSINDSINDDIYGLSIKAYSYEPVKVDTCNEYVYIASSMTDISGRKKTILHDSIQIDNTIKRPDNKNIDIYITSNSNKSQSVVVNGNVNELCIYHPSCKIFKSEWYSGSPEGYITVYDKNAGIYGTDNSITLICPNKTCEELGYITNQDYSNETDIYAYKNLVIGTNFLNTDDIINNKYKDIIFHNTVYVPESLVPSRDPNEFITRFDKQEFNVVFYEDPLDPLHSIIQ